MTDAGQQRVCARCGYEVSLSGDCPECSAAESISARMRARLRVLHWLAAAAVIAANAPVWVVVANSWGYPRGPQARLWSASPLFVVVGAIGIGIVCVRLRTGAEAERLLTNIRLFLITSLVTICTHAFLLWGALG